MDRRRQLDNELLWHPFTPMQAYRLESAPIIESAEGHFLQDTDGKRYLDGVSSLWCNVHGHRVPEIDAAIVRQLGKVAHSTLLGLGSVPSIELAERLVRRAPRGLTKVFYSDNGSTALEVALKIAYQFHRQKTGGQTRDLFVRLSGAYHGDTIGAVSVGGIDLFHATFDRLLFRSLAVPAPAAFHAPAGWAAAVWLEHCREEVERVFAEHGPRIAGMVIEPLVQGAAGMLVHPPGYLRHCRDVTRRHDALLIADEVAVGCGRTGTFFACEQEDVVPDLLCLAKGLTGGYLPLAATLATDRVFDAFLGRPEEGKTFYHGHTYTGNALGCAAAIATLNLFDERDTLANVRANAAILAARLAELADWPHVGEVRQKGVMVGVELVRDRESKAPYPAAERRGHQVTLAARKRGVILRPLGDVVVLMPAPAMPADLIHQLCDVAIASIREVTQ